MRAESGEGRHSRAGSGIFADAGPRREHARMKVVRAILGFAAEDECEAAAAGLECRVPSRVVDAAAANGIDVARRDECKRVAKRPFGRLMTVKADVVGGKAQRGRDRFTACRRTAWRG